MGLVLADLTDEQKREREVKSGVLVEDVAGAVRGNVQPGDVILAVISQGTTTEARSADQVNALLAKLDKGASVAMRACAAATRISSPPFASTTASEPVRRAGTPRRGPTGRGAASPWQG